MAESTFTKEQLFADLEKDGLDINSDILKHVIENAKEGDGESLWTIGYDYDIERKNYTKALAWYQLAADKNYSHALNNLGMLWRNGQGVEQDYLTAMEWWIKAAKQNNVSALLNIGDLFNNGQGVPVNTVKAQQWYHINEIGTDKEKLMKKLIKETVHILNTERRKKAKKQANTDQNDTNSSQELTQNQHALLTHYQQKIKLLTDTSTSVEQENQDMVEENKGLKETQAYLKQLLTAKDNEIKLLKEEKIQNNNTTMDSKEVKRIYKRLVRSQANEIKLLKLLLHNEKRSKRKLANKLQNRQTKDDKDITDCDTFEDFTK